LLQCGQNNVESLWPIEHDQQAMGTAESRTLNIVSLLRNSSYYENDEPQPQECLEFGLMKLNPWRISVSS
jgi:hypothetical protein